MLNSNPLLEEARKHVVTPDTCFGVHMDVYGPSLYYNGVRNWLGELDKERMLILPVAILAGEDWKDKIVQQLEPLLQSVKKERAAYIKELLYDVTRAREYFLRHRREALGGMETAEKHALSNDDVLTLLTPAEEKRIVTVWQEAKPHPETQAILRHSGKAHAYQVEKPYYIIAAPERGDSIGGHAFAHANAAVIYRKGGSEDEKAEIAHSYYSSSGEKTLLHENVHILGQSHTDMLTRRKSTLWYTRTKLKKRLQEIAADEYEAAASKKRDSKAKPNSLFTRWMRHQEPLPGTLEMAGEYEQELQRLQEEEAKGSTRAGLSTDIAHTEKSLRTARLAEERAREFIYLLPEDRVFIAQWQKQCEKLDPALTEEGCVMRGEEYRKNFYLFRDMVQQLICDVAEIEGEHYKNNRYQDEELGPRIVEFVRHYVRPENALCRNHPAYDLINLISPDVVDFYRDVWIPEMEQRLGPEEAAKYKQPVHISEPVPVDTAAPATEVNIAAPAMEVTAKSTLQTLGEIASRSNAGAIMLMR